MNHEHSIGSDVDAHRCESCNKIRLTVQIFRRNGEAINERVAWIPAPNETAAVDYFLRLLRIDFRYRFLGAHGFVLPSNPNDYLIYKEGSK